MIILLNKFFTNNIIYQLKNLYKLLVKMENGNTNRLDYRNKLILAPMVRVGTLPIRLLALRYGADIVYSEELIDWKLLKTTRRVNSVLGTVDFVDLSDGTIVFRTCPIEKDKVVLQIGTANAERALKVAKMVENDIAGIDINMGCPKEFSIKGGMGAALLANPENAKHILKTLVDNVRIPVTCKIRIFLDVEKTINLIKEFQALGISAIAVHGRTKQERPQHPVHADIIKQIAQNIDIPVIANGGSKDIERYTDILKFKEKCGTTSVMVARAAQWNCSIFSKTGMATLDEMIVAYLKLAIDYDNSPSNSKYCVQMMLRNLQETPKGKQFLECQTLEDLCDLWDLGEYCRRKQLEYYDKGLQGRREVVPGNIINSKINGDINNDEPALKKFKCDEDDSIITHNVAFFRAHYPDHSKLPKSMLHSYIHERSLILPNYETRFENRLFQTILSFNNKKYTSSFWEKNKRSAEQGAALVCLLELGVVDKQILIENGIFLRIHIVTIITIPSIGIAALDNPLIINVMCNSNIDILS